MSEVTRREVIKTAACLLPYVTPTVSSLIISKFNSRKCSIGSRYNPHSGRCEPKKKGNRSFYDDID